MFWAILGILVVILTASQFLPQVYKSFKTKKLEDVSLTTYIMLFITASLWIAYGYHINDNPVIITNILILFSAIAILSLKYRYR